MSVHVMSWVLRNSEATLGKRLVLLALADSAEDDGGNAWPSVATIARKARLSERQVQYALRQLEAEGAIQKEGRHRAKGQRYGTHVYRVIMKGADSAPFDQERVQPEVPKGAIHDAQRVQPTAPEPSLEQDPSKGPLANGARAPSQERPRNEIWDALTHVFGEPATATARTLRGKICRSLKEAGATPDEIIRRAQAWPRHFESATLTETALEKHWTTLGRKPLRIGGR